MTVQYQNNKTGDSFDITELISNANWETKRSGSPAKLELSVLRDPWVIWAEGGVISVRLLGRNLFYGYVFKVSQSEKEEVEITAYDQTRYLKNKETYVFSGARADQILSKIAADFKLKLGILPNTGYVIPSMVEDGKPLFDIILGALDRTLVHAGRMFYLWDDFGSLRLSEVLVPNELPLIGEGSLADGYTYTSSIDGETYNKIKLLRDNKETGKRDVYIAQDSNNITLWGILQYYEKVDDNLNEAQVKERCEQMLSLYNRPEKTLSISAISEPGLRAGQVIYVSLPDIGVAHPFLIEEATHDLLEETMDLKVKVI